jgi:hypothetical protein
MNIPAAQEPRPRSKETAQLLHWTRDAALRFLEGRFTYLLFYVQLTPPQNPRPLKIKTVKFWGLVGWGVGVFLVFYYCNIVGTINFPDVLYILYH